MVGLVRPSGLIGLHGPCRPLGLGGVIVDPAERMHQMALLCRASGWSLEQFKKELQSRYPNGPRPDGDGWDRWESEVENLYQEAMK